MKQMTFVAAIREFLSLPGEGAGAIMQNVKGLTPKDKDDLKRDFLAIGIEILPSNAS